MQHVGAHAEPTEREARDGFLVRGLKRLYEPTIRLALRHRAALDEQTASIRGERANLSDALARLDGRPSVQGVLEREPGTNVVQVARALRERLEELERSLAAIEEQRQGSAAKPTESGTGNQPDAGAARKDR